MDKISLKAAAKINLYLKITGTRPDGYHNLDTLMSSVDIYDEVTVIKRKDNLITCQLGSLKGGVNNTAYKAAKLISDAFNTKGADIFIRKNIPFSAGLGGSSADAAAVFYAMNQLYELGGLQKLESLALNIGSDVPFMMYGGLARILGTGEKIEKKPLEFNYKLLIIKGKSGLSTRSVYGQYDKIPAANSISTISINDISSFTNDLQLPAISLCPELENNIKLIEKAGAVKALMTGSGSAVYGFFDNDAILKNAYEKLKHKVHYCKTANLINRGIEIINKK